MYSCALLRDILLQGRLYISRNWLCFYANLFGKDIKVGMSEGVGSLLLFLRFPNVSSRLSANESLEL